MESYVYEICDYKQFLQKVRKLRFLNFFLIFKVTKLNIKKYLNDIVISVSETYSITNKFCAENSILSSNYVEHI